MVRSANSCLKLSRKFKTTVYPESEACENSKLMSITCKPESQSEKPFQSRGTRDAGASGGNFLTLVFFYEKEHKTTRLLELRKKANFSLLSSI